MFSVSNAFGGFEGEFLLGKDCLITCGGLYEYENGKWNYKFFSNPWLNGFEGQGNENYLFDEKNIYKWDTAPDKLVTIRSSSEEIHYISDHYYVTKSGVYSINTGKSVLKYNVAFGENPVFNDLFLNVYAKNSSGQKTDILLEGKNGSIVVKYFFIDSKSKKVTEKEVTLWEGKAPITLDSEELFYTKIGNCICYHLQDESDDEMDPRGYAVIHEIIDPDNIKTHTTAVETWDDISFSPDPQGNIFIMYAGMQYQSGVKADLSIQNTSDITISGGSETNKNADDGSDNWLYDKKRNLVNSFESASLSEESDKKELFNDGNSWVGFGDEWDYKAFTLETAAKLQFDLEASDAAKFTIYRLDEKAGKNGVTYTVKTLQSTALKNRDGNTAQTKELLLESGTYYISMQSLNAKKDGNADYNISVSNKSFFYTDADNGFDNWLYDKKRNLVNSFESASISEESDTEELFNDGNSWVGFGDEWDYKEFTLETAAKLQFDLEASDAAKFTIYRLDEKAGKNGVTYTVKTLQSTALRNIDGMYTAQTKELLLESGTYYISMQALNAKKGGYADYDISFGWDSYLYTKADDGDDNWLYNSKTKEFNDNEGCIIYAGSIEDKVHLTIDDSTLGEAYCWVGFGDEWDHYEFSVDTDMAVSFNISSSDAIKVMIYQIVNGKLKTLQTTSVKADSTVYTKTLNLKADGEYYIGIQSTNAKKGGNAEYSITGSKYFQPLTMTLKGYNHDQFEDQEEALWEESDWNRDTFIPAYLSFLKKKNLLIDDITGTDGHDTISIAANKCCSIAGTIDLKDGNDQFIVSASGGETFLEVFTEGTLIDFGEDNDILKLEKNSFVEIDHYPTGIEFGNGNDLLEFGENAALCGLQTLTLDFGEGNDKLNLLKNSDRIETAEVSMGAGNDTISIDSIGDTVIIHLDFGSGFDVLSVRNKAYISELDFGDGYYNKLVINKNGTLCVDELNGVANVSGNGTLAVSNIDSLEDQMLAELKKSDIDLVAAGYGFTSRKQEAADNSKETAAFIQDDNTTFWLGSEAFKEENGEYGFADTEDWFMAYLNNEDYIMLNLSEGIRCTVYNKREEVIATYADYGHNFEIEKDGLYYFHMEYLGDSHASGRIKIDD